MGVCPCVSVCESRPHSGHVRNTCRPPNRARRRAGTSFRKLRCALCQESNLTRRVAEVSEFGGWGWWLSNNHSLTLQRRVRALVVPGEGWRDGVGLVHCFDTHLLTPGRQCAALAAFIECRAGRNYQQQRVLVCLYVCMHQHQSAVRCRCRRICSGLGHPFPFPQ